MSGAAVVSAILYLVVLGLVFWLLWWLIEYCGIPEPFHKVAKVLLAVLAVAVICNVLLGLTGHPLIRW